MSKIINNVDLDKVITENGKKEKLTLRKPIKLYGEWNLDSFVYSIENDSRYSNNCCKYY